MAFATRSEEQKLRVSERNNTPRETPEIPVPDWLRSLKQRHRVLAFDTARFPLRELAAKFLLPPSDDPPSGGTLESLHCFPLDSASPPPPPTLLSSLSFLHGKQALPPAWSAAIDENAKGKHSLERALRETAAYRDFRDAYEALVREVLAPAARVGGGAGGAYAQREPTLRVHLAGQGSARGRIGRHKDADYEGHVAMEVNFWIPLVEVGGSNSLFVESAPGLGDFEAVQLEYGQLLMFDGYSCEHHTVDNESGATRVSIDTRVVPAEGGGGEVLDEALRGKRKGKERALKIGDYAAIYIDNVEPSAI
jgi:hypothetical protein